MGEGSDTGGAIPHRHRVGGLRASIAAGLVVILPLGLTIWLMWSFAGWVDRAVMPLIPGWLRPEKYLGLDPRGIGIVFFLAGTVVIGWFAKGWAGRTAIGMAEALVWRMPIVRPIYRGVKQIAEAVVAEADTAFDRVCLVEYPCRGRWALALVVIATKGELATAARGYRDTIEVLVPKTPNPLTGYLLLVPRREVIELDLSLEDGLKLIMSGGIAQTPPPPEPAP